MSLDVHALTNQDMNDRERTSLPDDISNVKSKRTVPYLFPPTRKSFRCFSKQEIYPKKKTRLHEIKPKQ